VKTLAGLLALSGAAFKAPEPTGNIVEVPYDDVMELKRACGVQNRACSKFSGLKLEDLCTIRYMRGNEEDRQHELQHCEEGSFHKPYYFYRVRRP
jgi:hypothetical protein